MPALCVAWLRISRASPEIYSGFVAVRARGPLPNEECIEVSHEARANHGTELLCGQPFSLPSVEDCYHWANRCLDMWNDSVDHAAQLSLLRMADAWLQLAFEQADAA